MTGDTNLSDDLYVNNTYNNVGIGANTTVGTYKLDVTGSIRSTVDNVVGGNLSVTGSTNLSDDLYVNNTYNNVGIGANTTVGTYKLDVTGSIRSTVDNVVGGNLSVTGSTNLSDDLFVNSTNQNVGIGTITPNATYKLDVSGNLRSTGNVLIGTNTLYANITSGNVGIGTITPAYTLDVTGNIRSTGNIITSNDITTNGNVNIGTGGTSTSNISYSRPGSNYVLQFDVPGVINLNPTVGVGIKINNPTAELDVNGNCKIRGNLSTNGYEPNDMPTNWKGIRTFDVFAIGTVATGPNKDTVSASINKDGDGLIGRNLIVNGNLNVGGSLSVGSLGVTILNLIYPVGSIYMNYNDNKNPKTLFSWNASNWEQLPAGTNLVSYGGSFQSVGATGGNATVNIKHNHQWSQGAGAGYNIDATAVGSGSHSYNSDGSARYFNDPLDGEYYTNFYDKDISTYSPYVVVYIWKRTA